MKSFILIAMFMLAGTALAKSGYPSEKLINALIQVESSGKADAIGDGGNAVGILQIWPAVIEDVNRVYKVKYTLSERKNPVLSKQICRLYLKHYGKYYTKKTGKTPTNQVLARIWNGGPAGYKKEATVEYWNKVKRVL